MKVLVAGEALFDFISKENNKDLTQASNFEMKEGGAPLNVAVGLSRLGNKVSFLTKLSKDKFGKRLLSFIENENIDTKYVLVDESVYTPIAFVSLKNGIPDFVFYKCKASYSNIRVEEIEKFDFSDAKLFHFDSIAMIDNPTSKTFLWLFNRLKGKTITSLDPNVRKSLIKGRDEYFKNIEPVMSKVGILKMSEEDTRYPFSSIDVVEIARILKRESKITIITMGDKGASLYYKGNVIDENAWNTNNAIDTTGCGDAFMAGFTHMILKNKLNNLKESLRFATKVAGIVATRRGAARTMPTIDEIS